MSERRTSQVLSNNVDHRTERNTGSSAIAITITEPSAIGAAKQKWVLEEIRLSLDDFGGQDDLTITINSGTNAVYDHVLLTQDMTSIKYLRWIPDGKLVLDKDDEIDIAWDNANSRTYGVETIKRPEF